MERQFSGSDIEENIIEMALQVEKDGRQRALPFSLKSLAEAQELRRYAAAVIQRYNQSGSQPIEHAGPWVWRTASGGRALSREGELTGFELRFSYYKRNTRAGFGGQEKSCPRGSNC